MPDTPVTWLDDFVVNLKTTGVQNDPSITVLASGHFLVVWTDFDNTGVGAPAGADIVGRVFDSLGAPVTDDIRLNTATLADQFNVEVTALPGGGFTIVYDRANVFNDLILDAYDYEPGVGVSYVGGGDLYSAAGSDNPIHPVIAANSDTDALAAYHMIFADGTEQIFLRPYNPSTNTFGAADDVFFGASGAGEDLEGPEIVALGEGRYALAVVNRNAGTDTVNLLIREANGTVTIHTIDSGFEFTDVAIAALTTGRIVVAYTDTTRSGDIAFDVVNDDGSPITGGGPRIVAGSFNAQVDPAVVGLADGSFIIAWLDATTGEIRAERRDINESGPFVVSNFLIDDTGGAGISGIKLAAFADGRFAITWEAGDDIRTKIMDSRDLVNDPAVYTPDRQQIGTIGDDVFTADLDADQVFGHDGHDTITENGFPKQYFGGKGDDTLLVNSAIDTDLHDGGDGTDTIDWSGSSAAGGTFNLAAGTATAGGFTEKMTGFENLNGTNNGDIIVGGIGVNILNGNAGDDTIRGEGDVDTVNGGAGNDTIIVSGSDFADNVDGGTDTDLYQFDFNDLQVAIDLEAQTLNVVLPGFGLWGSPVTVANVENVTGGALGDTILGDGFANVLKGRGGADTLKGGGGGDTLDGGEGADEMTGGLDDDTYFVDTNGDVVVEGATEGTADHVKASVSYNLLEGVHVEFLSTTDEFATTKIDLTGNEFSQFVVGNHGENTLDGRGGGDILLGNGGDDTYIVNSSNDVIQETDAGGANDQVLAKVSFDLLEGVHIETFSAFDAVSADAINLYGNTLAQTITGNAGANLISDGGKGGPDVLKGLGGDDTYRVYNSGDTIVEGVDEGANDTVLANVSFDLLEGVHIETFGALNQKSTAAINLSGNALAQQITGNAGKNIISDGGQGAADVLKGLGGDDTYVVFNSGDTIVEGKSEGTNDTVLTDVSFDLLEGVHVETFGAMFQFLTASLNLYGNTLAQQITGNAGKNIISDGGKGAADVLKGLAGDDTYRVYNSGTVVVEGAAEGASDTVLANVSFDLLEGVHIETFGALNQKSTAAINLYGNTLKQTITGNAGANLISDGGKGAADVLKGLGGNDTYRVYNSGDTIVEGKSEGANDTVLANVSFDLLEGVYIETFGALNQKSTASLNLYGNRLAQEITGNAGRNIISDGGKGAADVLKGLGGNDTYRVYNAGTVVVEGAGEDAKDTVQAAVSYTLKAGVEVEVLTTTSASGKSAISLYGNELGQTITGNKGANSLRGYDGDDTINGGDGADKISGGLGNDTLAGNAGADTYYFSYALDEATNVDTIKGFSSIDLISLSASIFTQAGPAGALAASAFRANTTGKAGDASDRIIWETDTGKLYYDPDGTGAAAGTTFAIITGNTGPINAGDFVIA